MTVQVLLSVMALGAGTRLCCFKMDSFIGEKFGRVLSCDVERKKLVEPIGVIDEVMLQANGDPSRRLNCIYGYKFLGDVSEEEADRLAEEACASLLKLGRFTLKERAPHGRVGFLKAAYSRDAYAFVQWDDHFFQQGKVLRLGIGRNVDNPVDLNLHVDEVSGYKIGVPAGGDGKPRTPFWKFERIVNEVGANGIVNGVHALHDVSALSLEDAAREFEEARRSVERLLGITMFKSLDYDEVKVYECYGKDVHVFVKMEYLNTKQIRYSVLANGNCLQQIDSDKVVFWLCIVVLVCGVLMLLIRYGERHGCESRTINACCDQPFGDGEPFERIHYTPSSVLEKQATDVQQSECASLWRKYRVLWVALIIGGLVVAMLYEAAVPCSSLLLLCCSLHADRCAIQEKSWI